MRKDRIARNEVLFREVNERIQELGGNGTSAVLCLCECGAVDCSAQLSLTAGEYSDLRKDPVAFAVLPGHVEPEVEYVVLETDRFTVVRKRLEEQARARMADNGGS